MRPLAALVLAMLALGCEPAQDPTAPAKSSAPAAPTVPQKSARPAAPNNPPPQEDAMNPRGPSAGKPLGHAPSQKEAVEVFKQFWNAEMMKPGASPGAANADGVVRTGTPSVKRIPLRAYKAFVVDRIGNREPNQAILLGTLGSLDKEGACWEIAYDGMLGGGVDACVDAQDGSVIFIWRTPEG